MRLRAANVMMLGLLLPLMVNAAPASSPTTNETPARILGTALRVTDLDRSTQFYTHGLGMVVATTLKAGTNTEVILAFSSDRSQPVILLFKDETPGKSPPIEHGNGYGRIMLRIADADALVERLHKAGYAVGDIHENAANHVKVFWVEDPDGYQYEITAPVIAKP